MTTWAPPVASMCSRVGSKRDEVNNTGVSSQSASGGGSSDNQTLATSNQAGSSEEDLMEDTLMKSPDLGSAESTTTIAGTMKGALLGCSDTEIKNNSVGKTKFTPYRYQLSDSREYCEIHQEISQVRDNWNFTGDH